MRKYGVLLSMVGLTLAPGWIMGFSMEFHLLTKQFGVSLVPHIYIGNSLAEGDTPPSTYDVQFFVRF